MRPGSPSTRAPQPSPALSAAMAGAVDLAAVKARNDAAARAAEQPPRPVGAYVIDVDEASFQAEVIDRSFQVPVVLDLWAEWCEPCKQLSPILEQLAGASNGSWILAKIDVDANPRISQALQVQGIPAVFAAIGGQLVPGFQGALPAAQVAEFIGAVVQAGEQAGLQAPPEADALADDEQPSAPEVPVDPRFDAAEDALDQGDYALAAERFQAILNAEPANADAAMALRQVRLLQRIDGLDVAVVKARAAAEPNDVEAALAAADVEFATDEIDAALARLLTAVKGAGAEDREVLRDRLVEFFELLGPEDPRVGPTRRELARALF
jgi:putative thioredoxin